MLKLGATRSYRYRDNVNAYDRSIYLLPSFIHPPNDINSKETSEIESRSIGRTVSKFISKCGAASVEDTETVREKLLTRRGRAGTERVRSQCSSVDSFYIYNKLSVKNLSLFYIKNYA